MSYGEYRPRRQKERPSAAAVVLLVCLIGAILSVILLISITQEERTVKAGRSESKQVEAKIKHDSLCATYTYDGEVIRWYVFVDPDYGTQWLYNDHDWHAFPRVDDEGRQIGVQDEAA